MRQARRSAVIVAALLFLSTVPLVGPTAQAATTGDWNYQRASTTTKWRYGQAGEGFAISGNGRFVAFTSSVNDHVRTGEDGHYVFVKDFRTGALRKVSDAAGSVTLQELSLSETGRELVYTAPQGSDSNDVMMYDTSTRQTRRLVAGATKGIISADGKHLAYLAYTPKLGSAPSQPPEIHTLDLSTGNDQVVSALAWQGLGTDLSISADGGAVAWWMSGPGHTEMWHRNLVTGVITRLDTSASGAVANYSVVSMAPAMTGDGRWVTFQSYSTNLVPGTMGRHRRIYLKDAATGSIRILANRASGGQLSEDGKYFAFESTTGPGRVRRVSGGKAVVLPPSGERAVLSTTGRYVAYQDSTNERRDIYRALRR